MKQLIHSALGKLGYRLTRIPKAPTDGLSCFFSAVKQAGFAPRHIVDVGANHGSWTRRALKYFPNAQYTLIEPQNELRVDIQDLVAAGCNIRWVNAGAGEESGKLLFTIADRDDSSTFVLTEQEARAAGHRQVLIEVKTLNELVSQVSGPFPEMVKIDAEGLDLRVLSGASELLGRTEIFLVEAAVCAGLENTMAEVVRRMGEAGYRLIDITDLNRSPKHGVLWLCELAFLRNGSDLLDKVRTYE